MSSRPDRAPGRAGAKRVPIKVDKPFPWGTVIGGTVLALALVGLLVYAATNQGGGRDPLQTDPDNAIEGVQVTEGELSQVHVQTQVDYPSLPALPPTSGEHNQAWQTCDVYTEPIAPEHAVHSLEHGAVWVTYNDDLADGDVSSLEGKVRNDPYRLMSPLPEQESPLVLTAWGRQLPLDSADDRRVDDFLRAYTQGPQTPERGATCQGGVSATGPFQGPPAGSVPAPASPLPMITPGEADEVPGVDPEDADDAETPAE